MRLDWLDWSNPVAVWWCFLVVVSTVNVVLWLQLRSRFSKTVRLVLLSAVYVFGCAFRAIRIYFTAVSSATACLK